MRIGLNLLYLIPAHVGGTQTYAQSLLTALARLDTQNQYVVFLAREAADLPLPEAANFKRVVCPLNATNRLARYAWEQAVFPFWLRRHKIDLVHSLGYVCPLFPPCASVVTIHDINYIGLGSAMPRRRGLLLRFFVPQSARRADHVIAISNFAKSQIVRFTGVPARKVSVTHEAAGLRQSEASAAPDWDDLATRYQIKQPYIVAFSSLSAHKNMARLLRAYAQLRAQNPELTHDLVLVGHLPPDSPLPHLINRLGLENAVLATGYVPDEHVQPLLSHAQLFVFPSWYEGFGLPILEAQSAGVAVACSQAASLPEVAGEGAVFFPPRSIAQITGALQKVLQNAELRADLVRRGHENLHRFSWEKTARQTLDVYQVAVSRQRSAVSNGARTER